jgi:CheY-like chemotaxis protein
VPCTALLRLPVVDDSRGAADSLAFMPRPAGHDVRTASGGPGALGVAGRFRPRLVLPGLGMPRMDGYEVARRLRNGDRRGKQSWRP